MDKINILKKLNKIAYVFENNGDHVNSSKINDIFLKIAKLPKQKEEGHKSPPKGYPKEKKEYGDTANYKYPLDTEKHVRAAWSYIHQERNRKEYTSAEFKAICDRIKKAGKKFGIDFADEK